MAKPSDSAIEQLFARGYRDTYSRWRPGKYIGMFDVCPWDDPNGVHHGFVTPAIPVGKRSQIVVEIVDEAIQRMMHDDQAS